MGKIVEHLNRYLNNGSCSLFHSLEWTPRGKAGPGPHFFKHFSNIWYPSAVKPILPVQDIIWVKSKTESNLWKVVSTLLWNSLTGEAEYCRMYKTQITVNTNWWIYFWSENCCRQSADRRQQFSDRVLDRRQQFSDQIWIADSSFQIKSGSPTAVFRPSSGSPTAVFRRMGLIWCSNCHFEANFLKNQACCA